MAPYSNRLALATILQPTVGAYFIGAIVTVGLSGITTLQSWSYFQRHPQDPAAYKLLVALTWTLEILRSCVTVHAGYYYSVRNWGNVLALLEPVWSMEVMVFLSSLVTLCVHCFFVHKVWKVTQGRAKVLCSIITLFVLGDFALGLATYFTATLENNFIEIFQGTPQHVAIGGLCCAISADWLITFALVQFFRQNKARFNKTNYILDELIFYAINMGTLVSVTDTIVLILFAWPTLNFYQLTVYEVVGSLYANSLLACLNARDELSQPSSHHSPGSVDTVLDSMNHALQLSQQTWISSGAEASRPASGLMPQAAMFTHAV